MAAATWKQTCSRIFLVCVVAVAIQVMFFSPLPDIPQPSSSLPFPSNSKIQKVIKLGQGFLKQPDGVALDKTGVMYTTTRDGWIKRLLRNGTWEDWWKIGDTDGLLGLTATAAGGVIVCDVDRGLLKVSEEGVTVAASHVHHGAKIRFADDVIESLDGTLYFSIASTKFGLHDWPLDIVEAIPHGQLLKYDPQSNVTSILLEDLAFANGVALSPSEDYLVVCESWKYRCLKYWLKGDLKGQIEIFINNLPGAPDNINLAPDGSFWIALIEIFPSKMRFLYTSKASRYLIRAFPKLSQWVTAAHKKAMVVNVGSDGKMIRGFDDPAGKVMGFVTSALEFEGHLYLGTLYNDFIGKLPLPT
ncbi:putative alkaloid synthase/Surface mucin Hemomucin [Handroanthus impetiginosus]|uniref:Putative alkaloid synthase/Surface mucin Hemomucin n=1 Tax=Handroanthus impetiginosus TaxID=429701 RepID=A0A2G9I6S7_9LAMI|nr:putative alkaloid synthase/Surface mucin Hemomucin [Handroanthus impetiginosus]